MSGTSSPLEVRSPDRNFRPHCPSCGSNADNATRIRDLEAEVAFLTEKATATADKVADYEEEIRHLKTQRNDSPVDATLLAPDGNAVGGSTSRPTSRASSDGRRPSTGRFSSFLSTRKALPTTPQTAATVADLQAALARESHLREQAEQKAAQVTNDIEDLTATLFEEANEMVATERRDKAKLEERLAILEEREKERQKRLARIEGALARIERVRTLLAP